MFSHSDPSLLPLVGDIVQDVLLALDTSYDEMSPLFCTVLHSFMKALEISTPMDFEEDTEGRDVNAELPAHITIAKDVMERCIHLLRLRLKVLDVLELCVCVLSEEENELLPMAHRCWPALLLRLTADDPLSCPPSLQGSEEEVV